MYRFLFILFTTVFLASCNTQSPEDIMSETRTASDDVSSYTLNLEYTYEDPVNEETYERYSGTVDASIDSEQNTGRVYFIQQDDEYDYYYDNDDTFENILSYEEPEWKTSVFSVDQIKELYFTEYEIVTSILSLMEDEEIRLHGEEDTMYEAFYEIDGERAKEVIDAIGVEFPEEESTTGGTVRVGVDKDSMQTAYLNVTYTTTLDDTEMYHELTFNYSDINSDDIVEQPEDIDNIE